MAPSLQRLQQCRERLSGTVSGAPTAVASLIQTLFLGSTFYCVAYSRGMFLFEQKLSGMDSNLEKLCQNCLCEICSLTTEPLRSLRQEMSLQVTILMG